MSSKSAPRGVPRTSEERRESRRKYTREYLREWRKRNPEKERATKRRYKEKHRERYRETQRNWKRKNPVKLLLWYAKSRAKRYGLPFNLTEEDIVIPTRCPVLGIPLVKLAVGVRQDGTPSLDKVVNSRGYVRGNVLVVSWRANGLKGDATKKEMTKLAEFYNNYVPPKTSNRR